jgi:hypothetical protein
MREKEWWRIAKEVGMVLRSTHNNTRAIVHGIKAIRNQNKAPPHHPLPLLAE